MLFHTRILRLRTGLSEVEMLGKPGIEVAALSEGLGPRRLFQGVRRLELVADRKLVVRADRGFLPVEGPGIRARFGKARCAEHGTLIRIQLERQRNPSGLVV